MFTHGDKRASLASRPCGRDLLMRRSERSPLHDVRQHHHRFAVSQTLLLQTLKPSLHPVAIKLRISRNEQESPTGGARRDRTDDLLLAKQALSQLSYGPRPTGWSPPSLSSCGGQPPISKSLPAEAVQARRLVGLGRFELPTSRLSSARSNQLSYKPSPGSKSVIRKNESPI